MSQFLHNPALIRTNSIKQSNLLLSIWFYLVRSGFGPAPPLPFPPLSFQALLSCRLVFQLWSSVRLLLSFGPSQPPRCFCHIFLLTQIRTERSTTPPWTRLTDGVSLLERFDVPGRSRSPLNVLLHWKSWSDGRKSISDPSVFQQSSWRKVLLHKFGSLGSEISESSLRNMIFLNHTEYEDTLQSSPPQSEMEDGSCWEKQHACDLTAGVFRTTDKHAAVFVVLRLFHFRTRRSCFPLEWRLTVNLQTS